MTALRPVTVDDGLLRNQRGLRIVSLTLNVFVAALLGAVVVGCATPLPSQTPTRSVPASSVAPTYAPRPNVHISNGTILTVTLVVNGQSVGDFPPDGTPPTIDVASLPPIPWNLQARSPSGRVLTSLQVQPG